MTKEKHFESCLTTIVAEQGVEPEFWLDNLSWFIPTTNESILPKIKTLCVEVGIDPDGVEVWEDGIEIPLTEEWYYTTSSEEC